MVCDLFWSTHIAIGDLFYCSFFGRRLYVISPDPLTFGDLFYCFLTGRHKYVISSDPLTFLLVISLTVPWLAVAKCMWSPLIHSHCYWWCYWWSVWLFLDWQPKVCDLCWSTYNWWSVWLLLDLQPQLSDVCDLFWSNHIVIGDLSDCSLTGRMMYVISSDPLTLSDCFLIWQRKVGDLFWSTHIAIGDLSDCSLTGREWYVIYSDPITLLLMICLNVS